MIIWRVYKYLVTFVCAGVALWLSGILTGFENGDEIEDLIKDYMGG